jgi:predicted TIM-barrel fold metal-dependent hydrolase
MVQAHIDDSADAPMIWANSADSHFLEPEDLFTSSLPAHLAERLPRSEPDGDTHEIVHIDGRQIRRRLPNPANAELIAHTKGELRPPGAHDLHARLKDLDDQGVWGELVFPSLGLWNNEIRTREVVVAAARVLNDYVAEAMKVSSRFVPTATLPLLDVGDALAEAERCAEMGFRAVFLPVHPPETLDNWNYDCWEPLWALAEQAGLVLSVHIGTQADLRPFRGPGGALINFNETTYWGQRAVVMLACAGVLERHPDLRVLVAEGGATWVPFVADRVDECFRQQPMFRDGRLSRSPKGDILRQVYASFQHDPSAIPALTAMGYNNVMFGTDYPHLEGTFPNTQATLRRLFDGVPDAARERITQGAFLDLFPEVGRPPAA